MPVARRIIISYCSEASVDRIPWGASPFTRDDNRVTHCCSSFFIALRNKVKVVTTAEGAWPNAKTSSSWFSFGCREDRKILGSKTAVANLRLASATKSSKNFQCSAAGRRCRKAESPVAQLTSKTKFFSI